MTESEKQKEVRSFVDREIFACQSTLVDNLLAKEIFSCDDVENIYHPDNEDEAQEIFEWWVVSSWFADKLKAKGEPILHNGYGIWWGRCCAGQAIHLDGVIIAIYDEVMN